MSLESLIKDRVAETTLRQMSTTFYTNTPASYKENIISGVAPKIGFDREEDKDIFYILVLHLLNSAFYDFFFPCNSDSPSY